MQVASSKAQEGEQEDDDDHSLVVTQQDVYIILCLKTRSDRTHRSVSISGLFIDKIRCDMHPRAVPDTHKTCYGTLNETLISAG